MGVQWKGSAILEMVAAAAKQELDESNKRVADAARSRVHVVSGQTKEGISVEAAERNGPLLVSGRVGVGGVPHAIFEEIRHPFIRVAYDAVMPGLAKRIASRTKPKLK